MFWFCVVKLGVLGVALIGFRDCIVDLIGVLGFGLSGVLVLVVSGGFGSGF